MKRTLLVFGTVAVCSLSALDAGAKVTIVNSSPRVLKTAPAVRDATTDSVTRERWTGTRAILRDAATGTLRKPTAGEARELVRTLRQLTARPAAAARTVATTSARGGVSDSAPAQVVIARATAEGGMETLCVQTFEEAADFLGLVKQPGGNNQQ